MSSVAGISTLKHLDVCSPGVTDRGVQAIAGLSALEVLWLSQCRVTDAVVSLLCGLPALRELAVGGTLLTPAGRTRLRELLPDCHLVKEGN